MRRHATLVLAACASLGAATLRAQPATRPTRPLSIDDALGAVAINGRMPVLVSPDGEWVAYTVYDARRRRSPGDERFKYFTPTGAFSEAVGCEVRLTNTRTGETITLGDAATTTSNPVWSPNGKWLAYYSDKGGTSHLWLWDRVTRTGRPITAVIPRPFFGFAGVRWSEDSKRVVLKALPVGVTVAAAAERFVAAPKAGVAREPGSTVVVYRSPAGTAVAQTGSPAPVDPEAADVQADSLLLYRYSADIAVVDVPSGAVRRVARSVPAVGYWISPDGDHVVYSALNGFIKNTQQGVYSIFATDVGGGAAIPRVLVRRWLAEYGISLSFSPDGGTLAYTTFGQLVRPGEAYVVPIQGGEPKVVTRGVHPIVGDPYRAPLWSADGRALVLLAGGAIWRASITDGSMREIGRVPQRTITEIVARGNNVGRPFTDHDRSVLVTTRDSATKRVGMARIDLATGAAAQLFERDQYFSEPLWSVDVTGDGSSIVYVAEDARHPQDVWVVGRAAANPRRLTSLNPHIDSTSLGASRLIRWVTSRGDTLRGALLLPASYAPGTRYPLVVKLYAGSMLSNSVNRFGGSGSGVENFQLLSSRGYAVLLPDVPQRLGSPMKDIADAVLPALDSVVAMGIADPNAIGVTGHSYGGYSTLALITQSTRFKAAVSSAGPANLVAMYGQMSADGGAFGIGWSETGQGLMGGTPWQYRDRFIENSPIMYLDRVTTPLLIVQGGIDQTVPPWQSDAVFVGLRRLGKEVEYARYDGEDHWEGTWSSANATDYWKRVIGWFDEHLKPAGSTP